jgi:hydroxypyruvate isomerase
MHTPNSNAITRRRALAIGAAATLASGAAARAEIHSDEVDLIDNGRVIRNNHINQTLCQWCYTKLPLEQLCEVGAKLGYKGIDLVEPAAYSTLKKYNLVGTTTKSHGITKGLNRKENWDECLGTIRKAMDAASEAGFPNVITFSGNREGMDEHEGLKNCAAALKQVVGEAEKKKVLIIMELLNSKVNHKDYMCDHSDWGIELVKAVGSEHFKLLYDIYHMQIMEGDVIATIKNHHQYFGHYHTAGVPGRHEIDESQELYYPAVMKAIVATGFKGWVGQEFIPVRDTVASITQAAKICDV